MQFSFLGLELSFNFNRVKPERKFFKKQILRVIKLDSSGHFKQHEKDIRRESRKDVTTLISRRSHQKLRVECHLIPFLIWLVHLAKSLDFVDSEAFPFSAEFRKRRYFRGPFGSTRRSKLLSRTILLRFRVQPQVASYRRSKTRSWQANQRLSKVVS